MSMCVSTGDCREENGTEMEEEEGRKVWGGRRNIRMYSVGLGIVTISVYSIALYRCMGYGRSGCSG